MIIFFSGFTAISLYNNINLLKDSVVEDLERFSDELKISAWNWSTTKVVSTESTEDSGYPTIAVDGSGNVHIAWYDETEYGGSGDDWDIFYKHWNMTTANWTTTEVISTEGTNVSYTPTIAVDDYGNVFIAWEDLADYNNSGVDRDIFYKYWNATTATWTTTEVVSTESTGSSYFSTMAVDGSGNVHIAWNDYTNYKSSGGDLDIFYKYWNATTATWNTTEVVSTESTAFSSEPTIAVDGFGNVYIAWEDQTDYKSSGADNDIFYKYWNATTATWNTTEVISNESTSDSCSPTLAVDGSENVHIAWHDETEYGGSGDDWDIFYKYWNATTANWTTTEVISTESTDDSFSPTLAVDFLGKLHIAWQDETNYGGSGGDYDIFYKHWNATTATWTTTEVISTESAGNSHSPTIAVDFLGKVHIAWTDKTNYGGSGGDDDIFYKKFILSPSDPSIVINNGDASTNSTLANLTLSADGAEEMCFRNGTSIFWTNWEAYATTKQLYLEGSTNNTGYSIYVKFRNATGVSPQVGDSILFLIFTPLNPSIIINNGDASTNSTLVNLTLSVDGATEMCFKNGTDVTWTSWEAYITTKQLYLEGSTNNTQYSIDVKFRNATGETSPVGDSILYLIFTPLNPSIIINNGDATTDSVLVTLTLSADGATEMCFRNWTGGSWTSWEAYSTTKQLYLEGSTNNTEYSVYVKFRNAAGETSPVGDSILYLIFTPLNPSIVINNGDATTDSILVNLTLSADGATEMCLRNGTGGAWTSWEAYSTTKQLYLEGSVNNVVYSIYVKFRNAIGEISPVGDSILFLIYTPSNPSIIINNGDASTDSTLVTLTLSVDGADEMCFRNGTTGTWTSWESYGTTKQLYLEGSVNNMEYSIYVKFRNALGDTSPVSDNILYLITEETVIPGYPVGFIIISLLAGIGVIVILNKSKRIKLRN